MTTSLTVTSKGQVTLRKDRLAHLGLCPGQRLDVELLPGGRLELHAEQATERIEALLATRAVVADRPAAQAGSRLLAAGGDFADGVIAYSGCALGAETFVSFDRGAVRLLTELGESAHLL